MEEKRKKSTLKIAMIVCTILLGIDQISKIVAISTNSNVTILNNVLNFKLIFNNGIAFGIGQGQQIGTFIISNLIVLGIIARFIWLQKDQMDTVTMYALFIILSRRNWKFYRPNISRTGN
ncbi:MAG: signal peptidase II [Clostridia bacterium]|nr:signal peptidase II [Clostridia bacterium]